MIGRRTILGTAVAPVVARATNAIRRRRLWREGVCLDQYDTDRCVGFAAAADVLACHPTLTTRADGQAVARVVFATAERFDVYPGRVGATTMPGAAAALVELGYCTGIRWLRSPDQIIHAVRTGGPVVWASPWLVGMATPRDDRMQLGSDQMAFAHAALITGHDPVRGLRVRNSWGPSWAGDGSAWITVADFRRLWEWQPADFPGPQLDTYGEAYQPTGRTYPPVPER